MTTRFSHGRFPGRVSAGPASRSSCVIHRALSVCPSGPIYIPPSSKLTFHRREEERRGGRASSRSIIRRTGASGGLGKVLRELSETQQWAPTISTGEQRVCMTLLTMIPPSGRVRRGSSEDEVISQFTNPPRGFRSRLPYNSPLHCPLPFFPIPAPSSEPIIGVILSRLLLCGPQSRGNRCRQTDRLMILLWRFLKLCHHHQPSKREDVVTGGEPNIQQPLPDRVFP